MRWGLSLLMLAIPAAAVLADSAATPSAPATQPATQPASVNQTMDRLLQSTPGGDVPLQPQPNPNPDDSATGANAVAPSAPTQPLVREGNYVFDKSCRLTRTPDGTQWELTFDADQQTMLDPPMIILPNQKLATMESAAASSSRDLHFRVTGLITEYKSRNYILLEKVTVIPDGVQQF